MKRRLLIIITLLILLLAALGYWLYQNLERHTRLENTGPTLDVLINPWHAAQTFLKHHDIASHRAMNLHDVLQRLQPEHALILFNDRALHDRHHQRELMDWMHKGGHLIITANHEWDDEMGTSHDPFLDAIGVRLHRLEQDSLEEEDYLEEDDSDEDYPEEGYPEDSTLEHDQPESSPANDDDPIRDFAELMLPPPMPSTGEDEDAPVITPACGMPASDDIFRLAYGENTELLQIHFGYPYTLEDASGAAIRDAGAYPNGLLQYAVGQGRMTVLLETDIWHNRTIGDFDHAFLLWHLLDDRPLVWFVASHGSENLLQALWRTGRYLLIALLAWLLLWSWRRWVRFGPLLPDPSPERRQLLEHIEAGSRFQWHHQQQQTQLQRLRDDIWQHLKRHHGIDHQQDDSPAIALHKLADLCQQSPEQVHQAMTCPAPTRETQWIELISQLQTIRNTL